MRDGYNGSDQQAYDVAIDDLSDEIVERIDASKPITDFCVLGTAQVGMLALFFLLTKPILTDGGTVRLWAGAILVGPIAWALTLRTFGILDLLIEVQMLRIRRRFALPFDFEHRHIVFHAIWRSALFILQIAAAWGLSHALLEFVKLTQGK